MANNSEDSKEISRRWMQIDTDKEHKNLARMARKSSALIGVNPWLKKYINCLFRILAICGYVLKESVVGSRVSQVRQDALSPLSNNRQVSILSEGAETAIYFTAIPEVVAVEV